MKHRKKGKVEISLFILQVNECNDIVIVMATNKYLVYRKLEYARVS